MGRNYDQSPWRHQDKAGKINVCVRVQRLDGPYILVEPEHHRGCDPCVILLVYGMFNINS